MPERKVADWISGWMEATDNSEAPDLYREWTAVSAVASALERKVWLEWMDFPLYANMFVVLVGPTGARKSTATRPAQRLLHDLGIKITANSTTLQALITRLTQANNQFMLSSGQTIDQCAITVHSEELTVFLGYNNVELLQVLANWFDCEELWVYDTKGSGHYEAKNVWVNLIGGTTPELIQTAMPREMISGGMSGRTIFVFEEKKRKTEPAPLVTKKILALRNELRHDLEQIHILKGKAVVTDPFIEAWSNWYYAHDANPPIRDPDFEGYVARKQVHVLKLCIIIAASENSRYEQSRDRELLITDTILNRALDLLTRTERKMPYTFSGFGQAPLASVATRILQFIQKEGKTTTSRIMQVFYADLVGQGNALTDVLEALKLMNMIKVSVVGPVTWVEFLPNNPYASTGGQTP